MAKKNKLEEFVTSEKQARTIKVKTLIIGIVWLATIVAAFIFGGVSMSHLNDYVRSEVNGQVQTLKQVSKTNQ